MSDRLCSKISHRKRDFVSPSDTVDGVAKDEGSSRMLLQEVVEVEVLLLDGAVDAGFGQSLGSADLPGYVNDFRFWFEANHRGHL